MNWIFAAIVLSSVLFAALTGTPDAVGKAAMEAAKSSVDLAIGLAGYIILFTGLMKIVEEAGGLALMARVIRPVLVRLFPDVPADHPAMGAIIMNLAANVLGLGNAATPFGLKAMKELDSLNKEKGTATNAMVLFLGINTSGVAVLPTGIMGVRALAGSVDPASIFPTTLLATGCSTVTAVVICKLLERWGPFKRSPAQTEADEAIRAARANNPDPADPLAIGLLFAFAAGLIGLVGAVFVWKEAASNWILPGLIAGMVLVGVVRKVPVYETFVKGAKDGFQMALGIIPFLMAILVSVGMLRASGGLGKIVSLLAPITEPLGMPGEVLPLALLRPLSGSGAFALTTDLIKTHGPDTYIGQLASTLQGSTETTFYVLAVYFGSIAVIKSRHAVTVGLAADLAGALGSILAVKLLLG
jgi:spore maturation protein SpmA